MRYILNHIALLGSKKTQRKAKKILAKLFPASVRTLSRLCRFPKELKISENFVPGLSHCRSTHTIFHFVGCSKNSLFDTPNNLVSKKKILLLILRVLRHRGVAEHFSRRDSSKAAVFHLTKVFLLQFALNAKNWQQPSRGNHPTSRQSSFSEHFSLLA